MAHHGDDRRTRLQIFIFLKFFFVQIDVELLQQFLVFLFGGHDLDSSPQLAEETAFRNSSMQAAYLIIACRALGLDTGPMSGFDRQHVDDAFFAGSTLKSNLLINIGYGDSSKLFARLPRLSFEEACGLL